MNIVIRRGVKNVKVNGNSRNKVTLADRINRFHINPSNVGRRKNLRLRRFKRRREQPDPDNSSHRSGNRFLCRLEMQTVGNEGNGGFLDF